MRLEDKVLGIAWQRQRRQEQREEARNPLSHHHETLSFSSFPLA
jgi:hypothetical protein